MAKYETRAGVVTRGETFAKLIDLVDQVRDQCIVMSHLHRTEGGHMDEILAKGWLGIAELIKRLRHQMTTMAMGKMQ